MKYKRVWWWKRKRVNDLIVALGNTSRKKSLNCLRVTTNVESFTTEVNTGERYVPVTEYVSALINHIKKGGTT